jgi:uncharacterized protein (UPF0212 family)
MRPLSARDILSVWERGESRHPVDRALTILAAACRDRAWEEMAALSIGERDGLLLTSREQTFGPTLSSYADCPRCGERLEFVLAIADILVSSGASDLKKEFELAVDDVRLRFRLPNSFDLAAIASCDSTEAARRLLCERCLIAATRNAEALAAQDLDERMRTELAERMSACDPQAEVLLDMTCPACNHRWQAIFDIAIFFWAELQAQAKRLLREVHILARAYGWREADILAMSATRRQFYLEIVT